MKKKHTSKLTAASWLSARRLRKTVQFGFLITVLAIGVQFALFVDQAGRGIPPTITRPPGVEAFLPISALVSLKYWLLTGVINPIHPSGLMIFLMIVATAVLLKRGFCSWICPIGLLSEQLAAVHRFIFRRRLRMPSWLDIPLRGIKYLLLAFFLWSILLKMDVRVLHQFIFSPYNRVADVKMYFFFADISMVAMTVLAALFILSVVVPYFWCRYLCPYGALLGGLSLLSLGKIRRDPETCINCEKCTRVCPAAIKVHEATTVRSDECHGCMNCVDVCPASGALDFTLVRRGTALRPLIYAAVVVFIFAGGSVFARLGGVWQNRISPEEYLFHIRHLQLPLYQHQRGRVPAYQDSAIQRRIEQYHRQSGKQQD